MPTALATPPAGVDGNDSRPGFVGSELDMKALARWFAFFRWHLL
jgi:hypothetical protein